MDSKMGWLNVALGIATGGIYTAGKTIYQAGNAIDQVSEDLGKTLNALGPTITKLGNDLSSFMHELEEMITIKRAAPRNEDDLWDEEVERLTALRQRETELLAELTALSASDDDKSWYDSLWQSIIGSIVGSVSYDELFVRAKLASVRAAIDEILYEEPGVIPNSIHNIQLILERFNTMEQPRLEDILDSVDDNLDESKEILSEVKKLFVVKTWKAVAIADLSPSVHDELIKLKVSLANYDKLIEANSTISASLQKTLVDVQPKDFKFIDMFNTKNVGNKTGNLPAASSSGPSASMDMAAGGPKTNIPDKSPASQILTANAVKFAGMGKVSVLTSQPLAVSIGAALNQNVVSGCMDNFNFLEGRQRFFLRERLKIEKAIFRTTMVPVEVPGVIPNLLEEIKRNIARVRTESQPRIETLLDSVNLSVLKFTDVVANVNKSIEDAQAGFAKNKLLIKISVAVAAGLFVIILLMSAIVLFRLAFGI